MNPAQLAIDQTLTFLGDALRGRQRVLEVGCGRGEVARRLGSAGFAVTALDLALPDRTPAANVAYVEADFLQFGGATFDAVVFTSSLHHIAPLGAALDRAHRLLVPGGRLVADEFDLDAPDAATLRWYYGVEELLAAAELFPRDHIDAPAGDVVERWRAAHQHVPPLHSGPAMRDAIGARFELRDVRGTAYLYRTIAKHLPSDARGRAIAEHVYAAEQRGIADGSLARVGLAIIADRA